MCGLCGVFGTEAHWTDAARPDSGSGAPPGGWTRRQERLQRLLTFPELANTAVLVNELGEVGLDHLLLRHVDETTVVLPSGCVCCALRADLTAAIRDLYSKRERGTIPRFDRLIIETTGFADPAPIIFTLMAEPELRHHFREGNVA